MILENETFEKFGYRSEQLKPQSHKRIIAKCDKCGKIRELRLGDYHNLCHLCSVKDKIPWNKGLKASEDERIKRASDAAHEAQRGKSPWNKNIPWSKEMKKKLSKAHKGQHSSPDTEFKSGSHPWNKGKTYSIELREKISKGTKANAVRGNMHPHWKGGISFEPYCVKFDDEFKEKIRNQYDRKCFICNKNEIENGRRLDVHHVEYNKKCMCDDSKCSFIPLCISCHSKTNSNRQYWKEYLQSKIIEYARI